MREYPQICAHTECRGHATPATWRYDLGAHGCVTLCERHAQVMGGTASLIRGSWTRLSSTVVHVDQLRQEGLAE